MIRQIIHIDEEKCNGCGLCANACKEAALGIVDGKAKLLREDFCDGLGNCLPVCPVDAIHVIEREAAAYDEQAVLENKQKRMQKEGMTLYHSCVGMQLKTFAHKAASETGILFLFVLLVMALLKYLRTKNTAPEKYGAFTGTSLICTGHWESWLSCAAGTAVSGAAEHFPTGQDRSIPPYRRRAVRRLPSGSPFFRP